MFRGFLGALLSSVSVSERRQAAALFGGAQTPFYTNSVCVCVITDGKCEAVNGRPAWETDFKE